MKYFILVNPHSGGAKGQKALDALLPFLKAEKIKFEAFLTSGPGQETELVAKILESITPEDRLIIIGGDGTLSIVVNALPVELAFSYIPAGSGNDFARSLGLSIDPLLAFKNIQKNERTDFYTMRYSSTILSGVALNNIGLCLDGQIVKSTNHSVWKKILNKVGLGSISYFLIALRVLFTKKSFSATVSIDGQTLQLPDAWLFDLTKHPYFGGGIKISPEQSNLENNIDLVEINKVPVTQFLGLLIKVVKGRHLQDPRVLYREGQVLTVSASPIQPVQIDGECFELPADVPLTVKTEKRTIIK